MREVVSKNTGQRAGRFEGRPRPWRRFLAKPGSKTRTPVNSRSSSWSSSPQVAGLDLKCSTMTSEKLCPFLFSLASVSYASVLTDILIVAIHRQNRVQSASKQVQYWLGLHKALGIGERLSPRKKVKSREQGRGGFTHRLRRRGKSRGTFHASIDPSINLHTPPAALGTF